MKGIRQHGQRGYALLIMLLMFMGIGGVVLAGFTQQARQDAEAERYEHNKRVLQQAKQALLMYAYNYPTNNPDRGPGRLPCPNTDNTTGNPDSNFNCVDGAPIVGRLPWADDDLNFYDARDASGERLWYAVSSHFANSISPATDDIINSDSVGTITLFDQSGGIIYDGTANGIAAILIAPGPVTKRDEDNDGTYEYTQTRAAAADQLDPRNYLDAMGGFDNSAFVNESAADADGFIMGPVFDIAEGDIFVNDQVAIITTAEVIAMAQKAVLDAYKRAIDDYHQAIWGAINANYRYPWLNAYADIADLNVFEASPGETVGRVPYLNYYTDHDSHVAITNLRIDFDFALTSMVDGNASYLSGDFETAFMAAFNTVFFGGTKTLELSDSNLSFDKIKFDGSDDISSDNIGTLVAETTAAGSTVSAGVVTAPGSVTVTRYFWDGDGSPLAEDNVWELCPLNDGDQATDCARDGDAPYGPIAWDFVNDDPITGWGDYADIRIRKVSIQFTIDPDFVVELDYDTAPISVGPLVEPDSGANARLTVVHDPASVTELSVANSVETSSRNFIDVNVVVCEQDTDVQNNLNFYSNTPPNPDGDTELCTLDLDTSISVTQFDVTADFYPDIPVWVSENGWDNSVLMAYADVFSPSTPPGPAPDCGVTPPCLTVDHDFDGLTADNISVLVGSGLIPANPGDLGTMFEGENSTPLDDVFDARPAPGDDIMLVFDEI